MIQLDSAAVADATTVTDLVKGVLAVITTVVVAVWALYKTGRGRVFGRKLNPSLSAHIVAPVGNSMVKLSATVQNVGQTKIYFDPDGMAFRLYVDTPPAAAAAHAAEPEWTWVATVPAFADHNAVEPQESLTEDKLFTLPAGW